jgi:predicted ATPase/DNA-binding winged helix-turn-helix (wHTH) protein
LIPLRFGPNDRFELRAAERCLLVDGRPVELGSRAIDVLIALAERSGRLAAKNELLEVVWPGQVVEENNLPKQISALRKILGADVILTIPGRGYQFVAARAGIAADVKQPPNARRQTNLAQWLPPLYGRQFDLASVAKAIREHRVVTLVGAGGIGKTRLAQAAAVELQPTFPGGVWLVPLEALDDPVLIAGTAAQALRLPPGTDPLPATELALSLAGMNLLLVIDNCEHLLNGVVQLVEALVVGAPGVRILATSREPLRVAAERVVRLAPLEVPAPSALGRALEYGAVQLFVNRTSEIDRHFALTDANVAAVVELCRQLDGIPLALELAAARVPLLGVEGVLARLDQRFRLLMGGKRAARARHQTLAAAFDWSYDMLSPPQRTVFDCLGVFVGGFALDSAQRIAASAESDIWAVLDHLGTLVDRSLVLLDDSTPDLRYRLFESGRVYALQRLAASGAEQALRHRHAREMADRVGAADRALLEGAPPLLRFAPLVPDLNNVRAALSWASGPGGEVTLAIELAAHALWLWRVAGVGGEGARWCASLAGRVDERTPPTIAARFWLTVSMIDRSISGPGHTEALSLAIDLYRQIKDGYGLFWALLRRALGLCASGNCEAGVALLDEAEGLLGHHPAPRLSAFLLSGRALAATTAGNYEQSRRHLAASIALCREAGDDYGVIMFLANLADTDYAFGDIDAAVRHGRELVALARATGRESMADLGFINLGAALAEADEFAEAEQLFTEGLRLLGPNAPSRRWALDHIALLAARRGSLAEAARITGWIDQAIARDGANRGPAEARSRARVETLLGAALADPERARLADTGARLEEDEVFALGLPAAVSERFRPRQ